MRNTGSRTPGIDGMTRADLRKGQTYETLKTTITEELSAQTYVPSPTRRVYIPKANGKYRPLGIPTLKDRIVQQLVKLVLEPIYEAKFLPCSYGFRPLRGTWDALAEAYYYLCANRSYTLIIEGDIQDCFGTIAHGRFMRALRQVIGDSRLLTLVWNLLKAGVLEELRFHETDMGTPQGGIVSPLLANVYMHTLDCWMHHRYHTQTSDQRRQAARKGDVSHVRYIRYADDFIVLMRGTRDHAEIVKDELATYIREELKMTLSVEKTTITTASDGFDFLGVRSWTGPRYSNPTKTVPFQVPSGRSVKAYKTKVRSLTSRHLDHLRIDERVRALNWLIVGWARYHQWGNSYQTFDDLKYWTSQKVYQMLRRRIGILQERTAYADIVRTGAECENLQRWHRAASWKTPAIAVGEGCWMGLVPMTALSTPKYWSYRGSTIPNPFTTPETETQPWKTEVRTELAVVMMSEVSRWRDTTYNAVYMLRRQQAFRRDRYTCVRCGYQTQRRMNQLHDLECHHRDPARGHALDNLETLCLPCHKRVTWHRATPQEVAG
jgi:group II intron reverse transcriptase/maturase